MICLKFCLKASINAPIRIFLVWPFTDVTGWAGSVGDPDCFLLACHSDMSDTLLFALCLLQTFSFSSHSLLLRSCCVFFFYGLVKTVQDITQCLPGPGWRLQFSSVWLGWWVLYSVYFHAMTSQKGLVLSSSCRIIKPSVFIKLFVLTVLALFCGLCLFVSFRLH
jgi:hypothetical protein